ncbi:hypothetical protein [Gillisia sp. CAL575]|uniref:hypothetical protein n=1 Tax=Gillisia sp. CAL575 TaxID=985255 RepID=UPI0003A06DA3|nr:hypothetical protein [Gillisia sp. CAL575]
MRQLSTSEIAEKFNEYSSTIEYANFNDVKTKLTQLINFLKSQDISNRILQRIEEDFSDLKIKLNSENISHSRRDSRTIIESLFTPDLQGAFGYFSILDKFKVERKSTPHYIELSREWYDRGDDYYEYQEIFNANFFKPFSELFNWYLVESKTESSLDYFSEESRQEVKEQLSELKEMLVKQGYGQQIIFDEIDELRQLTERVNKKNWFELIKGKFIDLALGGVISTETAKMIIEVLTGSETPLLK